MDNEKLMARLAALPAPDFMHVHKLSDPIGSGASYRADTVARLIDEAVATERERVRALLRAEQANAANCLEGKAYRAAHDACGAVLQQL